jgi:hypothetical protein
MVGDQRKPPTTEEHEKDLKGLGKDQVDRA